MKPFRHLLVIALALGVPTAMAANSPFNDALGMCLVKKTTEDDRKLLMRWMFMAMAAHPDVKELSRVTPAQGEAVNARMAALVWDLLSVRCRAETKEAVKYDGAQALATSFEVLGRVAMQGLLEDPHVTVFMGGIDRHIDKEAVEALFKDDAAAPATQP